MTLFDLGAVICAGQGELVGRHDETTVLDELLGRARDGTGGALVLWGEPGIGKSALLGHVHDQARFADETAPQVRRDVATLRPDQGTEIHTGQRTDQGEQ